MSYFMKTHLRKLLNTQSVSKVINELETNPISNRNNKNIIILGFDVSIRENLPKRLKSSTN